MTELKKLIELIKPYMSGLACGDESGACELTNCRDCRARNCANDLLANGVIVPPCKVGDKVYSFDECSCEDIDGVHTKCEFYGYGEDDMICAIPCGAKCPYQYRIQKCYVTEANILMFARLWGKTVFPTKEEAEKALERREGK